MGRIGKVAGGVNKNVLQRTFKVRGATIIAGTVLAYMAANGMQAKEAGQDLRSDLAENVIPAIGATAAGTAEFVGLGDVTVPNVPNIDIASGGATVTVEAGDSWYTLLIDEFGMKEGAAVDCINRNNLGQVAIHSGEQVSNPC
jgi:hypothetical protein